MVRRSPAEYSILDHLQEVVAGKNGRPVGVFVRGPQQVLRGMKELYQTPLFSLACLKPSGAIVSVVQW
jgi:hypothetical protein